MLIDTYYYGKLVFAPINIVLYNVFSSHGPDLYGTEPWYFYFVNCFLNFNLVFVVSLATVPIMVILTFLFNLCHYNEMVCKIGCMQTSGEIETEYSQL